MRGKRIFSLILLVCISMSMCFSNALSMTAYAALPANRLSSISPREWIFPVGKVTSWTVPKDGTYRIDISGGAGGDIQGGIAGGRISGQVYMRKGATYYIAVGGNGAASPTGAPGGWNGGGRSYTYGGSGGGASCIYSTLRGDGTLPYYANYQNDIIVCAGGGGGAFYSTEVTAADYWSINESKFPYSSYLGSLSNALRYRRISYPNNWYDIPERNSDFVKYWEDGYGWRCNTFYKVYYDKDYTQSIGCGGMAENGDNAPGASAYTDTRGGSDTVTYGKVVRPGYDTQGRNAAGFVFGVGEDANRTYNHGYTGAGGGGLHGGKSVNTNSYRCSVGGGGSGYVKPGFFIAGTTANYVEVSGCRIQYIPEEVQLDVYTYGYGGFDGRIGDYRVVKDSEMTENLARISGKAGYEFIRYVSTSNHNDYSLINGTFRFGHTDTSFDAIFRKDYSLRSKAIHTCNDDYYGWPLYEAYHIAIDEQDNMPKHFIIEQSVNGGTYSPVPDANQNFLSQLNYSCNYTGYVQEYVVPVDGNYTLYAYGAGDTGLAYHPSPGSIAYGTYYLKEGTVLYIYVGGVLDVNRFNGGGEGGPVSNPYGCTVYSSNGCGATDIRLIKSTSGDGWSGTESLLSRLVTAGGGGGYCVCSGRAFVGDIGLSSAWDSTSRLMGMLGTNANWAGPQSNGVLGQGSGYKTGYAITLRERERDDAGEYCDYAVGSSGGGGGGWFGGNTRAAGAISYREDIWNWASAAYWGGNLARVWPFIDMDGVRMSGCQTEAHAGTSNVQSGYWYNGRVYNAENAQILEFCNTTSGKARIAYVNDANGDLAYNGTMDVRDDLAPGGDNGYVTANYSTDRFNIVFDNNKVRDYGKTFKFRVTCTDAVTGQRFNNVRETPVHDSTSGVAGYYWYVDNNQYGYVTKANAYQPKGPYSTTGFTLGSEYDNTWLHVAIVDRAGNLSGTTNVQLKIAYTVHFNPNKGSGSSEVVGWMSDQSIVYNSYTALNWNQFSRVGYDFIGWSWTQSWVRNFTNGQVVYNLGEPGSVINLYAAWQPHIHNVIYKKNTTDTTTPNTDQRTTCKFDEYIKTSIFSVRRTGWDFVGWNVSSTATVGHRDNEIKMTEDRDYTLYAIYKRNITLRLAEDIVNRKPVSEFKQTIYQTATSFNFVGCKDASNQTLTQASTRSAGIYDVKFEHDAKTTLVNKGRAIVDGVYVSTDLDLNTSIIKATTYFEGWYTASGYGNGTLLGKSGTSFIVTPTPNTDANYKIAGTGTSSGTFTGNYANRLITVYPTYRPTYVILPDAKRDSRTSDVDRNNGSKSDVFLGWFSKPQLDSNGNVNRDGGEYYGIAGDRVRITGNITLYPWFNVAPVMIHSSIADGFYENQSISYDELMTLVNVNDKDNPVARYANGTKSYIHGPEGAVSYDGSEAWVKLYSLNAEAFLRNELELSDAEILAILSQVNVNEFVPKLLKSTFYCDGLDSNGDDYSDSVVRYQSQSDILAGGDTGLNTLKSHVGKLELLYEITDNGIYDGLTQVLISKGYRVNSPITIQYVLTTKVDYNNNPTLDLQSVSIYNTDDNLDSTNIVRFVLDKQRTHDVCDDTTKNPWWAAGTDAYAVNDNTSQDLYDTLKIVDVYDIRFSPRYEDEHPTECANAKNIHKLSDLWKLKDTDFETFRHMTSYKIEFDAMDQWGKTASGLVYDAGEVWDKDHPELEGPPGSRPSDDPDAPEKYGQTKDERSIVIVPFNNQDDYDLLMANTVVSERIRYIDDMYADTTLHDNQYWGSDGQDVLQSTFQKYLDAHGLHVEPITGSITINGGHELNITINDYSND